MMISVGPMWRAGQVFAADSQTLHGPQGVEAVFAGEEILDAAGAVGESAHDGNAMRNALVSGHLDLALDPAEGSDFQLGFSHAWLIGDDH